MKNLNKLWILAFMLFAVSCGSDEEKEDDDELINPSNSNALAAVLVMPNNTQTTNGNPPSPSSSGSAPVVVIPNTNITSSNGSTNPLTVNYSNTTGNIGGIYVQVVGASSYFNIPVNQPSGGSGQLQFPIGIPGNVDEGEFTLAICIYDGNNLVSNIYAVDFNVLRLGTGALQISLTWNTATDQDLYVEEPNGNTIYYANPFSETGGELDRDDTDGYGPENIYWSETAPNGTYTVSVDDYEYSGPNTCYVTITTPSTTRSYTVTTQNGSQPTVVSFTKSGSSFSFSN